MSLRQETVFYCTILRQEVSVRRLRDGYTYLCDIDQCAPGNKGESDQQLVVITNGKISDCRPAAFSDLMTMP